jgi:trk/ktr system potassium uptake protein
MNGSQICRLLGINVLLIGAAMSISLPWAFPIFQQVDTIDYRSLLGLSGSMIVCGIIGGILIYLGQKAKGITIFRREAIAVVGLSWIMAMVLGAVPFWISQTCSVRTDGPDGCCRWSL